MGHGRFDDDVGALDIGVVNLAVMWDMLLMRAAANLAIERMGNRLEGSGCRRQLHSS